jgi:hypothetical protein
VVPATVPNMTTSYAGAWVPDDDPHRDWEDAAALAVDWVLEQAVSLSSRPVLVTNAFGIESNVPSLQRLLAYAEQVTPRSRRGVAGSGHAVLAYVPLEDALALAIPLARGGALGVVESSELPVRGWAREVGAVDLTTGQTSEPFGTEVAEELDRVLFYGNNGWTRGFGADQTLRILTDLRRTGFNDADAIVGYVGAHGKSSKAMARLRSLALTAGFKPPDQPGLD